MAAPTSSSHPGLGQPSEPQLSQGTPSSSHEHQEHQEHQEHLHATPPSSYHTDTEDDDDDDDTTDDDEDHHHEYDGHRPTPREMRLSRTRTSGTARSASTVTTIHTTPSTTAPGGGPPRPLPSSASRRRTTTLLSHIRSRPHPAPTFTHPLTHIPTAASSLVDFDGPDDPYKPLNWPLPKKVVTTLLYGLVTMSATWASSCYAPGTAQVAAEFGVSTQVAILGTSLFLVGFGIGPLLWAPLSEVYGRRVAVFGPMVVAACFSFGSGASKDFQALMVTRFFGAFFASAPVTNTGGVLGDLFGPEMRGIAMAGYAMAVVAGPALGRFFLVAASLLVLHPFFFCFSFLLLFSSAG